MNLRHHSSEELAAGPCGSGTPPIADSYPGCSEGIRWRRAVDLGLLVRHADACVPRQGGPSYLRRRRIAALRLPEAGRNVEHALAVGTGS